MILAPLFQVPEDALTRNLNPRLFYQVSYKFAMTACNGVALVNFEFAIGRSLFGAPGLRFNCVCWKSSSSNKQVLIDSFEGSKCANGLPHGSGKAVYNNGCTYEGDFFEGRMHGQGRYCFRDGLTYEGEFTNGEITGHGKYTWPSGEVYEGQIEGAPAGSFFLLRTFFSSYQAVPRKQS